jgi:dipeptidyl-peptidase-4
MSMRTRLRTRPIPFLFIVILGVAVTGAVATRAAALSDSLSQDLTRIFSTGELSARGFGPARWAGEAFLTVEPSAANKMWREIVRYDAATGAREVLVPAEALKPSGASEPLRIEQYAFSDDNARVLIFTNSRKVWRQNTRGDYWILDRTAKSLRKLGGDAPASTLMFAKFSPDGRRVAYVRDNDLYVEDIATAAITRLTSDGSPTTVNGTSDWVYEEELNLRDAFRWSPDSARIAYWHFDASGVGSFPLVDNAAGTYPAVKMIPYPKVGTTNSAVTVGVVSASGGPTKWINLPGDPRQHYIAHMDWAANANEIAIQQLNRLQNRNDVLLADATTGETKQILREQDNAWVDIEDDELTWIDKGTRFLWQSERDGWRRLYVVSRDGAKVTPITAPNADVMRVLAVDPKGEWVYYIGAPMKTTQRQLLRARTDGKGKPEQLVTAPGTHNYQLSPDCKWAIHSGSTFDEPPTIDLVRLPSHQVVRVLEDNAKLRETSASLLATKSEFFTVDTIDGTEKVTLDGRMIRPADFDPTKRYPTLVYVYGEPAGVTVTDAWGGRRELFHRALARDGFIVLSFDNRGTPAPKGRAWRKIVHGSVGVHSSKDQAAAIKAFAATHPFIDTNRMAIWGWSGGGSSTLNVMFRSPGLYQVGIAVAPVPDQKLYDTIYQERYTGLPDQNADGYKTGSPITYAEGLQGRLLIVHGSGDDNVHIQGSERLVNRLIELGKPFDYFVYPGRTHAIEEGPGTSLHLHSLIARYLKEHLIAPVPTAN